MKSQDEKQKLIKGHFGYVAVAGRPNVGKSSLINALLGYHLLAVSMRPQTTRRSWKAFYSGEDFQIVFIDLPGIHEPSDKLGEQMEQGIEEQLKRVDLVLCIGDPTRDHREEDQLCCEVLKKAQKPVLLAISKADLIKKEELSNTTQFFQGQLGELIQETIAFSSTEKQGLNELTTAIKSRLPIIPLPYDSEQLSDATEREIAAELIQEALFEELHEEIPHACAVNIDQWDENEKRINLHATILLERENHRKIIIGKEGQQLEAIKRLAIQKLKENIPQRINLHLFVKIQPDWRSQYNILSMLGLIAPSTGSYKNNSSKKKKINNK